MYIFIRYESCAHVRGQSLLRDSQNGWDVSKVGPVEDRATYDIAKNFAETVGKGEVQAKYGSEEKDNNPY